MTRREFWRSDFMLWLMRQIAGLDAWLWRRAWGRR